jgi:hypothetical protein
MVQLGPSNGSTSETSDIPTTKTHLPSVKLGLSNSKIAKSIDRAEDAEESEAAAASSNNEDDGEDEVVSDDEMEEDEGASSKKYVY